MLRGFHFDSRRLGPGSVFVALAGAQRDGHDFLPAATAAGAAAALVSRPRPEAGLAQLVVGDTLRAWQAIAREHRRRFAGPVVGISGSAGKTSTKDLLALLLGAAARGVAATEGNFNNELGVPLTLSRLDPTRDRLAVIEAGISLPGEMDRLAAMIEPDIAVITLIGPAHLQELGGLEGVAREKSRLPAAVRPGGLMVFPEEVAAWPAFVALPGRRIVVAAGGEPGPERVVCTLGNGPAGTLLRMAGGGSPPAEFRCRAVTPGLARNAALALTVARQLGVSEADLAARLAAWLPASLRAEVREIGGRFVYLDCYNANPASMADAFAGFTVQAPAAQPRLYLLGCMEELGVEASRHHRELGARLAPLLRPGDRVRVLGTEAAAVIEGLGAGGAASGSSAVLDSLAAATTEFATWPGAVLLKGSRRYALEGVLPAGEGNAHA
jgi:UDP-N-acetylmuramoyl-tripeptide--D-alanyl-D-alanine ligase